MTTRDDAVQGVRETARATASTVVEGVVSRTITVGAATPVVQTFCIALREAKGIVDEAKRNKVQLGELHERCELITVQVINKAKASRSSEVDFTPLEKCVDDIKALVERYNAQGYCARLVQFRRDGDDIEGLRETIEAVVPVMGLSAGVTTVDLANQFLALLQPGPELAPVPRRAPITKSSHVVRDRVVDKVCQILGGDAGPAVAALTGQSGAGKTTAAAAMVGERGDHVRALFPRGVVWLRVGQGAGAADRLPRLMLKLAKRLHRDVMNERVAAPEAGEDGGSYVKKIVSQEELKCLVVADDVWESEVVDKLRETGMWVLLTTRFREFVEPEKSVVIDMLTETEAEDVLRRAAELPPGHRFCDAAVKVLEICGHVAMDIAFVGSWTSVRTTNGIPKSKKVWERTVEEITAQIDHVRGQMKVGNTGEDDDRAINRRAVLRAGVLRAGFKYLAIQDPLAQELYAALAVFPDGHFFGESDAAVLLDCEEGTSDQILFLERWGVLKADASDKYRMHDVHMDFAREKLMRWENVREPAVERWTKHISRLDFAVGVDVYAMLHMWWALEKVGGKGWWVTRPYDDQLVQMDVSDRSTCHAVNFVAELFDHEQKFGELEALMETVLQRCDEHGEDSRDVRMAALYHTVRSLVNQGRSRASDDFKRRLGELVDPSFQVQGLDSGTSSPQTSTAFHVRGVCALAAGRPEDAEEWFRKALKFEADSGRSAGSLAVTTLHEMGRCVQEAGRLGEAEEFFKRALEIKEAKLGAGHLHVAWTLHRMGQCVRQAGRPGEAEALFSRALEIKQAKLGANDLQVAWALYELGVCVREAGRPGEAGALLRRALEIEEAKLGADDPQVAVTRSELRRCVREAGRPEGVEELFKRAPGIEKQTLPPTIASIGVSAWVMNVSPFTDFPGVCQCLLVNHDLRKTTEEYLSHIVVDPEKKQGWTVPMDVLKPAPLEQGDTPQLVSAVGGVSIEGPEDGLRRLNALLVPAPTVLEVGFKTYISLAPVLRWGGQDSKGPWVVRFSMADIEGFRDNNFSKYVSVFSRPTASPGDRWELLDRVDDVDDVDEASDEEETVSVVVPHFSDLIPTIDNATASEKCKGYIIKPRKFKLLKGLMSKTVLVHNASQVQLKYYQFWPSLIRTGANVSAEAGGVSVSIGGQWVPRNSAEAIDSGDFPPWPVVGGPGGTKYMTPPPDPQRLSTYVMRQNLCLVVYTGGLGTETVHAKFECAAANHVILLKGIDTIACRPREEMENVRRLAGLSA